MLTQEERHTLIEKLRVLPYQIESLVTHLDKHDLTTQFIPGEWTVAQNVHHLFDSHVNAYVRCKLIMTERDPTLKPYDQDKWANFDDASRDDISYSLLLLKGLHQRWVIFWETLKTEDLQRSGLHPEAGQMTLERILRTYAVHGEAHIEQITRTLAAKK